jgi:hypothetical protein
MPSNAQFAQVTQAAVAGTGAVTFLPASGNATIYRDIASLTITTPNAAAATLTISDGNKTVAIFNYPDAAAAPSAPFIVTFDTPLAQSLPNKAWTITASVNASGFNVTTQYVER